MHPGWHIFLVSVYESLVKSVDSETLCHIVGFISSQRKEIKIYTTPFKLCWPLVTFNDKDDNWLINASIAELRRRSDEVTIRVRGKEMKALRPLLEARSFCFKKLLDGKLEKGSLEIDGSYKSIQLVVLYAQSEPNDDSLWFEFEPCDSRDTTENTLNELINILHAASTFEMADLFGAVERHIIIHGKGFIYAKNAQEIKVIANEANAGILERYCDAFIATNLRTFTLFPSLPIELRMNIWRQMASQPQLVLAHKLGGDSGIRKLETPSHIAIISKVCRDSNSEIQQFWRMPSLDGINFKFDIIWLDTNFFPLSLDVESSLKGARYCAAPAPYPSFGSEWETKVDKIINCCPHVEVLYLKTKIVSHNDEIEYCRQFINREPTTLAEARRWIEESAHQRILELRRDLQLELPEDLREESPDGSTLPRIMLIDETEITRYDRD